MSGARMLGRRCLIVGGTGGIGLATARRFLDEGATVVLSGLVSKDLSSLGLADRVSQSVGDVSKSGEAARVVAEAIAFLGGRLDVLVHVAGISGRSLGDGPLHECSDAGWDRVLNVNAGGTFATNRAALRVMLTQDLDSEGLRGSIVNVGSVLSESPSPILFGTVAYAASKGAVRSLTLASAARYAADGVRFNLVEPGLIDTPMAARAVSDPTIRAYLAEKQPIRGGPGSAEDVAEAILFLSESASRFLTGVVLNVDGGWSVSEGTGRNS